MKTKSLRRNRPKITNAIPIMTALVAGVLLLAVTSLVIAFTLSVQDNIGDSLAECNTGFVYNKDSNFCVNGTNSSQPTESPINLEFNASEKGKEGLAVTADQLPNIGLVLAGAAVLLILVGAFAGLIALRRR